MAVVSPGGNDLQLLENKESGVFRGSVFEVSILTRYIAASLGNRFPTFRMNRMPSVGLLDFEEILHSDTTPYPRENVVLICGWIIEVLLTSCCREELSETWLYTFRISAVQARIRANYRSNTKLLYSEVCYMLLVPHGCNTSDKGKLAYVWNTFHLVQNDRELIWVVIHFFFTDVQYFEDWHV